MCKISDVLVWKCTKIHEQTLRCHRTITEEQGLDQGPETIYELKINSICQGYRPREKH